MDPNFFFYWLRNSEKSDCNRIHSGYKPQPPIVIAANKIHPFIITNSIHRYQFVWLLCNDLCLQEYCIQSIRYSTTDSVSRSLSPASIVCISDRLIHKHNRIDVKQAIGYTSISPSQRLWFNFRLSRDLFFHVFQLV